MDSAKGRGLEKLKDKFCGLDKRESFEEWFRNLDGTEDPETVKVIAAHKASVASVGSGNVSIMQSTQKIAREDGLKGRCQKCGIVVLGSKCSVTGGYHTKLRR